MENKNLLAIFEVEISKTRKRFSIYGNYEIEIDNNYEKREFKYPDFYNLTATENVNGKEVDYIPTGTSWAGKRYDVSDMIQEFMASLIQDNKLYTKNWLDKGLQQLVDSYITDDRIAITVNNLRIPKWILTESMYNLYDLILVTNEFIYYACYDEFYMLKTEDHSLVSDNYFASVGYSDSVDNIIVGREKLLWGALPNEEDI